MEKQRTYLCIDMKSFYASVECAERNISPFETNLVVADESRGNEVSGAQQTLTIGTDVFFDASISGDVLTINAKKSEASYVNGYLLRDKS